jgi:hypothetical protein
MMTFTIISGSERYKVTDLKNGGESFFEEKNDAFKMAYVLVAKLGHPFKIEDRKNQTTVVGGDYPKQV